jgi:hypothetical protein
MSAGGCANGNNNNPYGMWGPETGECAVIAPWAVGPQFFEANRRALQMRERLLPYIYTSHRSLFDNGVGIVQPLYYQYPALDDAYRMTATGNTQYFFGNDIMVAPVTAPAGPATSQLNVTARIQVWMPPGTWYDALTGKVSTITDAAGTNVTRGYTLGEVPMWFKAGSVIPYLPLESFPSLTGLAEKQYTFLGFRIVPGGTSASSSTAVYEDDGATTDYLEDAAKVWTTCNVSTASAGETSVTIKSAGSYPKFPATRSYQLRLPNGAPPSSVAVSVGKLKKRDRATSVPFARFGSVESSRQIPQSHQWYYSFAEDQGVGPVIDIVGVSTADDITVTITTSAAASAAMTKAASSGLYGTLIRAVYAHANMDVDRSNPDSNSPGPAYLSQLSSVGVGLESMADPTKDASVFASTIANVPALLANATVELGKSKSSRVAYTLDLLNP